MPEKYTYQVRDKRGRLVKGSLLAENEQVVVQRLREMGLTPVRVGHKKEGMSREISLRPGHVKLKALSIFSRQFATMVNSGLPILRALSILSQQTESKTLAQIVTEVRIDVERGMSLSAAMARHPKVFTTLYTSMIRAGETGGVLDQTLLRLADNMEKEVKLRSQIKAALTYPVVVLGMVSMILIVMLVFVVPQFKTIYQTLGGVLPLPTRLLLSVSGAVRSMWWLCALMVAGLVFGYKRYAKTDGGRERLDKIKLRIPVFGNLFHKTSLSRFATTLSVLLKSGVPILQSLDIVSETVNSVPVSQAIRDVQKSVKEGESMAGPLAKHDVFPPMVTQMLAVGEETGAVDTMLSKVAEFYDQEVESTVESLTSLIEPLMIGVIGAGVGMAVIALYLPMFKLVNLVK
ncbi:MAG: type II secretion system F family protein [Actinomycetota bacterium]